MIKLERSPADLARQGSSVSQKLVQVLREELAGLHMRLRLAQLCIGVLPPKAKAHFQASVLRRVGFDIAPNCQFMGMPTLTGSGDLYQRLRIGAGSQIGMGCAFDLEGQIWLGERVTLGHQVLLLTSTHEIGSPQRRAGELVCKDIRIGNDVWIGARSILLPGITVGDGAVIAVGTLVNRSVPPGAYVAGAPVRIVETRPAV
jgi:maltose O-acetyltransferase